MRTSAAPRGMTTAELALRLLASRGASTYVTYLIQPGEVERVIEEIEAELRVLDDELEVGLLPSSPGAERLLHDLPSVVKEVLLIGAESYKEQDWSLLDRRRSSIAREGETVFLTTPSSFAALMRVAPNLASWLGGLVFQHEGAEAQAAAQREQRLVALRAWSGKTDHEVIQAAEEGALPRDPEYAEWLVLLGRGDLLDA